MGSNLLHKRNGSILGGQRKQLDSASMMSKKLKNTAVAADDSATSHSSDDDYITIEKRSKKN